MHKISNSQVMDWAACTQRYRYAHVEKLKKKKVGEALGTGIITHDALQRYYTGRLNGMSHEEAKNEADRYLFWVQDKQTDKYRLESIFTAKKCLIGYFDHYQDDPNWRVLAVERQFDLQLTDNITMPMRLDLLVWDYELDGAYLVDTKTTYNMWDQIELRMTPQFPKYVAILRSHGIDVKGAIVNQIRTRNLKEPTPDQLFKREPVPVDDKKIKRHLSNHLVVARKIAAYREMSSEEQLAHTERILDPKSCKYCPFVDLCMDEMDGHSTNMMKSLVYERSDYGYE